MARPLKTTSHVSNPPKQLIVLAAAAGFDLLKTRGITSLAGLSMQAMPSLFPALTCPIQATLRTGLPPQAHTLLANGFYDKHTRRTAFWEQSSALVKGARIWEKTRTSDHRIGMYFFQQSLGEAVDELLSPAPIHTHGGGLIMATYQKPPSLLKKQNPVPLWRYWGPLASPQVGNTIASALAERIRRGDAPETMLVYLPTLDYDLQRYGVSSSKIERSIRLFCQQLETLVAAARDDQREVTILGDYVISDVTASPVYLNSHLAEAGYFRTREIKGMLYPDFHETTAFALCDHQVALIYAQADAVSHVQPLLEGCPGVAKVHAGVGDVAFILEAEKGTWFAYPWWTHPQQAPDYATHVDIHNKPGFDPCELLFGKMPFSISLDASRIRGTHGRADAPVAFASTCHSATTLIDFAQTLFV